jgi:exopolysaccharide production protein ExoZ
VERPPSLGSIQVFRGLAASAVALYHVTTHGGRKVGVEFLNNIFMAGHAGVDFFFVLSGFVMTWSHFHDAARPRRALPFMAARVLRIYPIYWVALVPYVLFYLVEIDVARGNGVGKLDRWQTYLHALTLWDQHRGPIIPVAWTLSYEILFYLFFAVLIIAGVRVFAAGALLWTGLVVAQAAGWIRWKHPILLSPFVLEFFAGCIAARIALALRPARSGTWLWTALALCGAVAIAENENLLNPLRSVWHWTIPFALLLVAGACWDRGGARHYPRSLLLIGDASYSLYLIHLLVIDAFVIWYVSFPLPVHGRAPLIACVMITFGAGVALYLLVERPLLAWSRVHVVVPLRRWAGNSAVRESANPTRELRGP